jgi:4-hydroxy-tetrahydrodipicolinate reductase
MGRLACRAVLDDPELELVAGVVRPGAEYPRELREELRLVDDVDAMTTGLGADVAVDLTRPDVVMANVRWLIEHGIHAVVGTSGLSSEDLDSIRLDCARSQVNAIVVPNFAIGAVLMLRFAEMAAVHMPSAEIIELHHEGKLDAPSGTAVAAARRIAHARGPQLPAARSGHDGGGARGAEVEGVPVHSVRLPGLVAHQEVIFGSAGQTLTIRHDSMDRISFMPGVILAIKAVTDRPGLTVGLEPLLGLDPPA